MKVFFYCLFLFACKSYAVFNPVFPYSAKSEYVRIISDNSQFGVFVKIEKQESHFNYNITQISFEGKTENDIINFKDDVFYEICYHPEEGNWLYFVSSPTEKPTIVFLNKISKRAIKCSLNKFLEENDLIYSYTHSVSPDAPSRLEWISWHNNQWKTLTENAVILNCRKNGKILIFYPEKKAICIDGTTICNVDMVDL